MDWRDFNSVFGSEPDVAYGRHADTIKSHRAQLDGELFIDKLLKLIKLDSARKLYPPRSNRELRDLFKEIVISSRPIHDQQSLIYYLLRDLKSRTKDPTRFAHHVSLPEQYRIFMDGLWFLDRLKFEEAVECLTEPILMHTFPEDILEVLLKHAPRLGLAYFHVVEPPVSTLKLLDLLFDKMCQASLTEAFFASRTYEAGRRRHIFQRIVAFAHNHEPGSARAQAGVDLVNLPLEEGEEQWLEDYLLKGAGRELHGSIDTMIMRQVAMGRTAEAARLANSTSTQNIDGINWNLLTQSL